MIINDPVHGFVEVPEGLLLQLVQHPYMQRLGRLKQLGATHFVFPGSTHTRFQHSLGAYYLAGKAIDVLRKKGVEISDSEAEALQIALLLHDIGHGPMSHTLEGLFLPDFSHEEITQQMLKKLQQQFGEPLQMAIDILRATYPRPFLHELASSQLDMDRLDYLSRDSYFAGVREGNVGVARIIRMLNVADEHLVVDEKGIYTLENYLMARRLMYWQVYLHKAVLAVKELQRQLMRRASQLRRQGEDVWAPPALDYFLRNKVDRKFANEHGEWMEQFVEMDDSDVDCAVKQWQRSGDRVLALLAKSYVERRFYRTEQLDAKPTEEVMQEMKRRVAEALKVAETDGDYFVACREACQLLYTSHGARIRVSMADGSIKDIAKVSELLETDMTDKVGRRIILFSFRNVPFCCQLQNVLEK